MRTTTRPNPFCLREGYNPEPSLNSYRETIAAYDVAASELGPHYDALPMGAALDAVLAFTPHRGLALDVGAGSGRDARRLRDMGFEVVAAEPAEGLRVHGSSQGSDGVRWIEDSLPSLDAVHRLSLSFDLVLLSAVWQHIAPEDRPRALRKLTTLLVPAGILVVTLRSGPAPADRPMHPTSPSEIEGLARAHGLEILAMRASDDVQGRAEISWITAVMRMPDDGTGALPLIRGIALSDDKSSTYKLGLLRAVACAAEHVPSAALPAPDGLDAIELPLGLVALFWVRMFIPLVRAGLPQAPRNSGPDGLAFAKAGFRQLLDDGTDAADLRVGAIFGADRAETVYRAISEAAATIASMPANFTRFPNSDQRVFEVDRRRAGRPIGMELNLGRLRNWGSICVPGHLWRALLRFGPWIEPMLVSEWARLTRRYAERIKLPLAAGLVEAALEWREPLRSTLLARLAAERLTSAGVAIECAWTGHALNSTNFDIDHCLPWRAWPCGDLWNLAPCDPRVNRHEKRDRLPSAVTLASSRDRVLRWWEEAYLADAALGPRFLREAEAALPLSEGAGAAEVFSALEWRRLRLARDQQIPEWTARERSA